MAVNQVSALPTPPSTASVANFDTRADAFLGALPTFTTEVNAVVTQMNDYAKLAAVSSGSGVTAASSTSLAIVSTGNISVRIPSGKSFVAGLQVCVWNQAAQRGMVGTVTMVLEGMISVGTITSVTDLSISVSGSVGGMGTYADWTVFSIPVVHDFSGAPTGAESFFPPSIQAILDRTANETRSGLVELATAAETLAGTSSVLAVHPAGLAGIVPDLPAFPPSLVLPFGAGRAIPKDVTYTRASSGSELSQTGIITNKGTNIPRFPFDGVTGECEGLLVEGTATNNMLYSNQLQVTHKLTLTSVTGTFQAGETVNGAGGSTGTVVHVSSGTTSYLGLTAVSGTFSGTVTGVTSGATGTYSAIGVVGVLTNITVAPDEASYGSSYPLDKINEVATTGNHNWISVNQTITAGAAYTFQFVAKKDERSVVRAYLVDSTYANGMYCAFNLDTGVATFTAVGSLSSGRDAGMRLLPDGSYWCWLSCIIDSTSTQAKAQLSLLKDGVLSYAGVAGEGLYVARLQFEAGTNPTSWIETTNDPVTRAADVCTIPTTAFDFSPVEGTMFVEACVPSAIGSATSALFQIDDGTSNNRILITRYINGVSYCYVVVGGTIVAELAAGLVTVNNRFRIALSWATNNFRVSLNGAPVVADSSGAVPTGLTTMRIGVHNAGQYWNGPIRHVSYFPRALTAAQLQAMTR